MTMRVAAYQHGIYPRSEEVVAATRGLERGRTTLEEADRTYATDREDFIRAQQEAGLDYFSDGLLRWQDIFRRLVHGSGGLEARTLVRWFNNNSFFRAPEMTGDLVVDPQIDPFDQDTSDVPRPRVATLPSPYLFSRAAQTNDDRNALMLELTREVLRPATATLIEHGCEVIHLQEPWLVYFGMEPSDWDDFQKAILELRQATEGATLVLHTYFGDAGPYADRLRRLPVDAIGVDFVETDLEERGGVPETFPVQAHSLVQIPASVYHQTINTGTEPMFLLAVYSPCGPEAVIRALPDHRSVGPGPWPTLPSPRSARG